MKRHHKSADGLYHIKGKTYKKLEGSRREVGYGTAYKTSGGLTLNDLIFRNGRWKSAKKHKTAKKEQRLQKYGYFAQKGKFGYVKRTPKRSKSKSPRRTRSVPKLRRAFTVGGKTLKRR